MGKWKLRAFGTLSVLIVRYYEIAVKYRVY